MGRAGPGQGFKGSLRLELGYGVGERAAVAGREALLLSRAPSHARSLSSFSWLLLCRFRGLFQQTKWALSCSLSARLGHLCLTGECSQLARAGSRARSLEQGGGQEKGPPLLARQQTATCSCRVLWRPRRDLAVK